VGGETLKDMTDSDFDVCRKIKGRSELWRVVPGCDVLSRFVANSVHRRGL